MATSWCASCARAAVVSCLALRTGAPRDAWAIDRQAHPHLLEGTRAAGVSHFVLFSATWVQQRLLASQHGKSFLLFGNGALTVCKPISDDDLAEFPAGCLSDASQRDRVLPIGGPGPTMTLRQQGEQLFALTGMPPNGTSVPVRFFDSIIAVLGTLGTVIPPLAVNAEFARIGRCYATESMMSGTRRGGATRRCTHS